MRTPIARIEPVIIALDNIDASDDVSFRGIDLETGARVCVRVERPARDYAKRDADLTALGLVLVLSVERLTLTN